MAPPRTRATAPRPPPVAVPAPGPPPPPPAARRRRQGLPTPPGRAASGRPKEEPQEGPGAAATPESGAKRPGGLPGHHGPARQRRREVARDGSPPARNARATPAASSLPREVNRPVTRSFRKLKKSTQADADMGNENTIAPTHPTAPPAQKARVTATSPPPPDPMSSTLPASATIKNPASEVNRTVTRSISQSARANVAVANLGTDTTEMRTGTDDIESLRRRLIVSESKVLKEKKRYCTDLRRAKDALQKVKAEKEAEILELKVQKQAEVQKVKAEKEAEILLLKLQKQVEVLKVKVEKEAEILEIMKRHRTNLNRACQIIDFLRDAKDALQKVEAEKEAEILELKVQKQAEVQKVKAEKEAEILELKLQKETEVLKGLHKEAGVQKVIKENIRILCIVDKKEAQLRAMSEHYKLLALKNTTTDAADIVR